MLKTRIGAFVLYRRILASSNLAIFISLMSPSDFSQFRACSHKLLVLVLQANEVDTSDVYVMASLIAACIPS